MSNTTARVKSAAGMSETEIQTTFIKVVRDYAQKYTELQNSFHCPNEGRRNRRQAQIAKGLGLESGVPDWFLAIPKIIKKTKTINGQVKTIEIISGGLWIEFKSATGSLSTSQRAWRTKLKLYNYEYALCRTWQDAWNIVCDYLELPKSLKV